MTYVNSTKPRYTDFDDKSVKDLHRTFGSRLYATDIDMILFDYTLNQGIAVIDFKYGSNCKEISTDKHLSNGDYNFYRNQITSYRAIAEQMNVPYFLILDFTDQIIPMFYIIAGNQLAINLAKGKKGWCTPFQYAKWETEQLRGLKFDPHELQKRNGWKTLNDLSKEKVKYDLPEIYL